MFGERGGRERRLFKLCLNLPARHCVAGVPAVFAISEPTCRAPCYRGAGCINKWCRNLPAGHCVTVMQAV